MEQDDLFSFDVLASPINGNFSLEFSKKISGDLKVYNGIGKLVISEKNVT